MAYHASSRPANSAIAVLTLLRIVTLAAITSEEDRRCIVDVDIEV